MRIFTRHTLFILIVSAAIPGTSAIAGQDVFMNSRDPGVKYCPAPWCDNSEFIDTHFGVDAKTGAITKYTGTVHPDETGMASAAEPEVLYVSPPISVENRYVPPAGAAPQASSSGYRQPRTVAPPVASSRTPSARQRDQSSQPSVASARTQPVPSRPRSVGSAPAKAKSPVSKDSRQQHNGRLPWWKGIFRR